MRDPLITNVRFAAARQLDVQAGLLGWISCDIDTLRVDGITVRRSRQGQPYLRFPTRRRASSGREFSVVSPSSEHAKLAIERQILHELERQVVLR